MDDEALSRCKVWSAGVYAAQTLIEAKYDEEDVDRFLAATKSSWEMFRATKLGLES